MIASEVEPSKVIEIRDRPWSSVLPFLDRSFETGLLSSSLPLQARTIDARPVARV